jgi:signal transduction histidine kinase
MREEIAHYLVHDMRNPLGVVIGNLSYIKSKAMTSFDESEREAFEEAALSAERLVGMVNNILGVYRMEGGKVELDITSFDLGAMVEDLVRTNRRIVLPKVSLSAEVQESPLEIRADKDMIQRVLSNLISNAASYTAEGSITVKAGKNSEGTIVSITDTGKGIPEEYREKIFEKFGRVERKALGFNSAFGLGLRFCQLAVDAHKGRITVESEVGKGSTFCVLLPAVAEQRV